MDLPFGHLQRKRAVAHHTQALVSLCPDTYPTHIAICADDDVVLREPIDDPHHNIGRLVELPVNDLLVPSHSRMPPRRMVAMEVVPIGRCLPTACNSDSRR